MSRPSPGLRWVTLAAFAAGLLWVLFATRAVLLPFIVATVCAYLLSPVVSWLQTFGLRREVAVTLIFAALTLTFVGATVITVPHVVREAVRLQDNLPRYLDGVQQAIREEQGLLEARYPVLKQKAVIDGAMAKAETALNAQLAAIPDHLVKAATVLSLVALIPLLTFLVLLEGRAVFDRLFRAIPTRFVETTLSLVSEIDEILGRYIRGQLVESMFVAAMSTIGLLIIGVDYAFLIGILAGLGNLIPYLGPVVGALPAIVVAFAKFHAMGPVLQVLLVFALVQIIDNNIVQPLVFSRGVQLNAVIVIFVLMAGAQVGGVLGMFLAVPVACIVKVVLSVLMR